MNLKPRAGLQVSGLWLRFIRVSTSSGDATKQGKSPPGNGVQAQIAATEGISACRNAVEDAIAGDAAGGLDVRRPERTVRTPGARHHRSSPPREATGRDIGPWIRRCAPMSASALSVILWTQCSTDCPRWPCAAVVKGAFLLAGAAERYESLPAKRPQYIRSLRQRFNRNGVDVPEDVKKRCAPSSPSHLVFTSTFG